MKKFLLLIICLITITFQLWAGYKYDLAITAVFQNESPYLKEWIEFHRLQGVQKFYLYNHLSTDNYKDVLKPYIKNGTVYLENARKLNDFNDIQLDCYNRAVKKCRKKVKWLAIIDLDEFITFADGPKNILDTLKNYESFGGLALNWKMYGTSNIILEKRDLMIEKLLLRLPLEHGWNHHVKSIVRPERVSNVICQHFPTYFEGFYAVDIEGNLIEGPYSIPAKHDRLFISHFWMKDEKFWQNEKIPRRMRWGDSLEFLNKLHDDFNTERDETMLKYTSELRKRMH